jgi:membrane-associated PAP2 superfamily phosphatase
MNRAGLLLALAIAAVVGIVFGVYPELDLALVQPFLDPAVKEGWIGFQRPPQLIRESIWWLVAAVAATPFVAVLAKLTWPQRRMLITGRAAVLMIATLVLGPLVLVNAVLKEYGGRPRPIDVTQYGGVEHFVPWWDPRGDCPRNCSFVAGEPSGAFWTLAPAAVTPPPWRAFAYAGALALGASSGLLRMMGGGHFFTDVVFAGVIDFLIVWLMHGLIYRWRATAISDDDVERALARAGEALRRCARRLLAGRPR